MPTVTVTPYEAAFQAVIAALGADSKQIYNAALGLPADEANYDDEPASMVARHRALVLLERDTLTALQALTTKFTNPLLTTEQTILPSATRTATITSPTFINPGYRGVFLILRCSANSGTAGLQVRLQGVSQATNETVITYFLAAAPTAVNATGTTVYAFLPGIGAAAGDITVATSAPLPPKWSVAVAVADSSAATYSINAHFLP